MTQLVIGWPKAMANTNSDLLAANELLTMLTVLMTPIVLKEIKVLALGEPEGQLKANKGTSDSTCFSIAMTQQC